MNNIKQVGNIFRIKNYGNLISSDDPIRDEDNWRIPLKCMYPRIILDDSEPQSRELYFVSINSD